RLVVIGAGIAGLSGAYEAMLRARSRGLDLDVTILEAGDRVGGKLRTDRAGVPLELGPDSFLASKPAARDLAGELGLELVAPSEAARRAYLFVDGALRPLPAGTVMGVPRGPATALRAVRSGIVGPLGAGRATIEPLLPGRTGEGPVAWTLRRRLGSRWSSRLVEPLVAGVYGASADQLGMAATLPAFHGSRSVMLAARRQPAPASP